MQYNCAFLYHEKEKVKVIWSPKAACTHVKKMFFYHENLLDEAIKFNPWIHEYHYKIFKKRQKNFKDNDVRYIQFTVSPYRRAVSSYVHLIKYIIPEKKNTQNLKNISFYDFLILIKNNCLEKNEHYKLQTFHNYKNLDIEYFKMEEIEDNYKLLKDKYNLNYKHFSSNHYIKKTDFKEFCGYTNYNDLVGKIPKHYKYFYNDKIRELVEEIYGIDIKNFNYTWEEFLNSDI